MTEKWIAPAPAERTPVAFRSRSESLLCRSWTNCGAVVALTSAIRSPIRRRKGVGVAPGRLDEEQPRRAAGRPVLSSDSPGGCPRVRRAAGDLWQGEMEIGDRPGAERPGSTWTDREDLDQLHDDPIQHPQKPPRGDRRHDLGEQADDDDRLEGELHQRPWALAHGQPLEGLEQQE